MAYRGAISTYNVRTASQRMKLKNINIKLCQNALINIVYQWMTSCRICKYFCNINIISTCGKHDMPQCQNCWGPSPTKRMFCRPLQALNV